MNLKKEIYLKGFIPIALNINEDEFIENFELLEFIHLGSKSNVYNGNSIVYKIKEKQSKQNLIMKMIFKKKNENINKNELIISSKLKNINIINFYRISELKMVKVIF